jgi:heat shock protein HtpX
MNTGIKTILLLTGLTVLLVMLGRAFGGTVGMVFALVLALVMNGVSYWFSDRIALRMAGAREVSESEAPALHAMVTELATYARLPKPRVYVIDNASPNAFATGRDPDHSAVAVTTGLMQLMRREELAGVIAHELAHIKNRDILTSTIVSVLAAAITSIAHMAQWGLMFGGFGRQNDEEGDTNPLAALAMIIIAPIAAMLIQFAISRQREYAADALGAKICGDPLWLANALRKLEMGVAMRPMVTANPAQAPLYIVHPFDGGGLVKLFSTHPPIAERVARLTDLARHPASLQQWA